MNLLNLERFRSRSRMWMLALQMAILGELGCSENPPIPDPAVSVPATADENSNKMPAVTASPQATSTSSVAIQFTDVAAGRLKDIIEEQRGVYLLISVNVAENCTGFLYDMKMGQPEPKDRYELSVINNLKVAVEKDDVKFLQGAVLDYGQKVANGPTGFIFKNSHEDVMLLPEYQALAAHKKEEWERNRKTAKEIDPKKAWAELLTDNRQTAFETLHIYNKYYGPHAETSPPANGKSCWYEYDRKVTHVMQIPSGTRSPLIVVFTNGLDGEPRGGFSLYDNQGREVDIYKNSNYLDEDATFSDINGDGVWEISQTNNAVMTLNDGPEESRCNFRSFFIAALDREPKPLLNILFEPQKLVRDSEWKCRLVPASSEGIFDVVLEKPGPGGLKVVATYHWDTGKQQYAGPLSGPGFIAFLGEVSLPEAKAFLKADMVD